MDMEQIKRFVIGLGMIALLAGAMAIALSEFKDSYTRASTTVVNESQTITPHTAKYMTNGYVTSIQTIHNASDYKLNTSHYVVLNGGTATARVNITNASYGAGVFSVSYTHYQYDSTWNITNNGEAGINNVMEYADTWGTIIGVVALISIVVAGFYVFRR